jgi:hypothetical protein
LSSKYLSDTGRGRYLQLCLPWASLQLWKLNNGTWSLS